MQGTKSVLFVFLICFLLIGCVPKSQIPDDIELISAQGYDFVEEGKFKLTVTVPKYVSPSDVKDRVYDVVARTSKEALDKINNQSSMPTSSGKLEVVIYNREFAKQGLITYVDTLQRDPSIGSQVYIAIAKNNAQNILNKQYEKNTDTGIFLSRLIEQNIHTGNLPKTNLHVFLYQHYQYGIDPFLPEIQATENTVRITGIAFINEEGKYVGSIDYHKYGLIFGQLTENFDRGDYTFNVNDKAYATLQIITSTRRREVKNIKEKPTIHIYVDTQYYLKEYSGEKINLKKTIPKIEKKLKKDLQNKSKELIKELKDLNVDGLGLGYEIKKRTRNWKKEEWKNIYEKVDVKTHFNVTIHQTGISE